MCLVVLCGILSPSAASFREPAYANSAAPIPAEEGRGIIFEKHDKIKIVGEVLDIDISSSYYAEVRATYTMKNISSESLSIFNMFLAPESSESMDAIAVMRNGVKLDYEIIKYKNINNADWDKWEGILEDNINGIPPSEEEEEGLRRSNGVSALTYTVDFAPEEQLQVVVEYLYELGRSSNRDVQTLLYYLTPAKYWQDFGGIEINLKLNEQYPKLKYSSLEFAKTGEFTYQYVSDTLPDKELQITASYNTLDTFTKVTWPSIKYILLCFSPLIIGLIVIIIVAIVILKRIRKRKT